MSAAVAQSSEEIGEALERYRREVAKRYRVIEPEHIERLLPEGKLWISTKLDGELWFLVKRDGAVSLRAHNGRSLESGKLIDAAKAALAGVGDGIYPGELVAPPDEGRPRVHHVAAALGTREGEARLAFFAFDVLSHEGANMLAQPYGERLAVLEKLFKGDGALGAVTTVTGTRAEAASYFREWVGTQRFEGIVARSEAGFTFKIKPTFSIDAVVVAYGSRLNNDVAELRELTVAVRRDDGLLQILGAVGNGIAAADRVSWHARLAKLEAPSGFRMANRDGTLCKFVRPEIVVEVQCSDLIDSDASGISVRRMTLGFDAEKGYAPTGEASCAAMLFPVFLRERTDKTVAAADIGMDQITRRLPLEASAPEPAEPGGAYALVERKAFVKGATAVRKVLLFERRSAHHKLAPYLVYFTDYSGTRAEPLKTSLTTAATPESARHAVDAWLAENVKRGWSEVGAAAAGADPAAPSAEPAKPKRSRKKPTAE